MSRISLFGALSLTTFLFFSCETPAPSNALTVEKLKGKWLIVDLKKDGKPLGAARLDSTSIHIEDNQLSSRLFPIINTNLPEALSFTLDGSDLKTQPELPISVQSVDEKKLVLLLPDIAPPNGGPAYSFELTLDRME